MGKFAVQADEKLRLRHQSDEARARIAGLGWPFLFLHGKHAKVPAGTVFETEVYDDTEVTLPVQMAAR